MDELIEDALKSTRNLYRLIMAVSMVTLVFAFSLNLPIEETKQKATLENLINADFVDYDAFVAEKVENFRLQTLAPIGADFNARLESSSHMVFNLEDLGEAMVEPPHIGKLLVQELALSDVTNSTLNELDSLNGLSLSSDVQIIVPNTDSVIEEIKAFLEANETSGRRIDGIVLSIGDYPFVAESFLPNSATTVGIYFELVDTVRTGATPVFSANFPAKIEILPKTSFIYWLENSRELSNIVAVDNGRVTFALQLTDVPAGFREEKIGILYKRLTDTIAATGPEKRSVTLLGAQIPGLLVVIASPLILIVLAYYFSGHTRHLTKLVNTNVSAFRNFSWMPLSNSWMRKIPDPTNKERQFILWGWHIETFISVIALPQLALIILFWKLSLFGEVGLWAMVVLATGVIGNGFFSIACVRNIDCIRALSSETK